MNARSALICGLFAIVGAACSIPSAVAPTLTGSIGLPHSGFLSHGKELPLEGHGFRVRSAADHHFGLPRLVDAIEEAAGAVADARAGTPPLVVGELSAKAGGALLPTHRSHRSGRDVDLLLYRTTLEGAPISGDSFTKIGADGIGVDPTGRFIRFDVDREWLLIRSLVTSKKVKLQWIFCARVLEGVLIEHAIALHEPPDVIARAEQLLQQPGDSLPHDDHIHVRVACEADELATGCDGSGVYWPWLSKPTTKPPTHEQVEAAVEWMRRPIAETATLPRSTPDAAPSALPLISGDEILAVPPTTTVSTILPIDE